MNLQQGNYAVRTLAMDPRHEFNQVAGCPVDWPVAFDFIGAATVSPYTNRTVVDNVALLASYNSLGAAFGAWYIGVWKPFVDQKAQAERDAAAPLEDELRQTIQNLRTAYQNWASLSVAQKDTAQKQSIRAIGLLFQLGKVS